MATPMILISGAQAVNLPLQLTDINFSYVNNFKPNSDSRKAHPDRFLWLKGEFQAMSFSLKLGALRSGPIKDAASLMATIEKIASMAMPVPGKNEVASVLLKIGTWFKIKGLMDRWDVSWSGPWDENGNPLVATVNFTITPTYPANNKPSSKKFNFRM